MVPVHLVEYQWVLNKCLFCSQSPKQLFKIVKAVNEKSFFIKKTQQNFGISKGKISARRVMWNNEKEKHPFDYSDPLFKISWLYPTQDILRMNMDNEFFEILGWTSGKDDGQDDGIWTFFKTKTSI